MMIEKLRYASIEDTQCGLLFLRFAFLRVCKRFCFRSGQMSWSLLYKGSDLPRELPLSVLPSA